MHRRSLLDMLMLYEHFHPQEAAVTERIRSLVHQHVDCFERTCRPGHVTGSAWILSADRRRVLLTHHSKLDRWLQLGGHADGQADVAEVARREAQEESGMQRFDVAHIEGRMARQTSLGDQQRTAVARAIVLRPGLVVLDEPTSHQDDEHVDQVLEAFLAVREQGTALLLASHDERVIEVADRTVRLDEGRVDS